MSASTPVKTVQVTPTELILDGCRVAILEAFRTRLGDTTWYHVVCVVHCDGVTSRPFTLDVRSVKELRAKLLVEISKLRMLIHL